MITGSYLLWPIFFFRQKNVKDINVPNSLFKMPHGYQNLIFKKNVIQSKTKKESHINR